MTTEEKIFLSEKNDKKAYELWQVYKSNISSDALVKKFEILEDESVIYIAGIKWQCITNKMRVDKFKKMQTPQWIAQAGNLWKGITNADKEMKLLELKDEYSLFTIGSSWNNTLSFKIQNEIFAKLTEERWLYRIGIDWQNIDHSLKNKIFAEKFFDEKYIYMVLTNNSWSNYIDYTVKINKFLLLKTKSYISAVLIALNLDKDTILKLFHEKVDANSLHAAGKFWPYITNWDKYEKLVNMIEKKQINTMCIDEITIDSRKMLKIANNNEVDLNLLGWYEDNLTMELKALLDLFKLKLLSVDSILQGEHINRQYIENLIQGYLLSEKDEILLLS